MIKFCFQIYMWHCAEHLVLWVYRCHGALVYLWPLWAIFGWVHFGCSIILFANVTSLNGAMTSYVMSQHHTCIGHATFCYKMAADTSWGVLSCCLTIHQVRLYHQRPACGWCLVCVGHNVSSMSPGWSLLPLTVIILLAFVNSVVSLAGTLKYLNKTWKCRSTPC